MAGGTVKWFSDSNGRGFITPEGGERFKSLTEGARAVRAARRRERPEATSVAATAWSQTAVAVVASGLGCMPSHLRSEGRPNGQS
jgi:cold shock CspA family protein